MRTLAFLICSLTLSACSHVHMFNQDAILPSAGVPIEHTEQKRVWFNFNYDTEFVGTARTRFEAKCPTGRIHSVSTRLSSENEFLSWISRIRFTGVCETAHTSSSESR